jgi:CheY-like chemotaxis protein
MDIDKTKESILVVDDDQRVCEVLKELFGAMQFSTASSLSGEEALRMLKEKGHTFLLADMKMPEMSGMELIRRTKENFPSVSVVAMTGFADEYKYMDIINARNRSTSPSSKRRLSAASAKGISGRNSAGFPSRIP